MSMNPPTEDWLRYEEVQKIESEMSHRKNALRKLILSGDFDAIKQCLNDYGDDCASIFVHEILSQIGGSDEPDNLELARRYWAMRKTVDRWLAGYLEDIVDFDAVAAEMKREGAL